MNVKKDKKPEIDENKKIDERLAFLRNAAGLTQEELADCLGVTRQAISNFERGKNFPDTDVLLKYALHFNLSTDFLLGNIEPVDEYKILSKILFLSAFDLYGTYLEMIYKKALKPNVPYCQVVWDGIFENVKCSALYTRDFTHPEEYLWDSVYVHRMDVDTKFEEGVDCGIPQEYVFSKEEIELSQEWDKNQNQAMIINDMKGLLVFMLLGGSALIETDFCQEKATKFNQAIRLICDNLDIVRNPNSPYGIPTVELIRMLWRVRYEALGW